MANIESKQQFKVHREPTQQAKQALQKRISYVPDLKKRTNHSPVGVALSNTFEQQI